MKIKSAAVNDDGSINLVIYNDKGVLFYFECAVIDAATDFGLWTATNQSQITLSGIGVALAPKSTSSGGGDGSMNM